MGIKSFLLLALLPMMARGQCPSKPNIVLILADDMGWRDVSWSNEPQLSTPNLEVLKQEGVELVQFYSQPKCTAARAALMTGRYPYRMGLQTNNVFSRTRKNFLNTTYKLMSNYMQDAGYNTHIVGKWHLGHCNDNVTPLGRGFHSFFGSWGNTEDYFHHSPKPGTYEWIQNNEPYWEGNGTYNTFLITNRSVDILNDHFSSNDTKNNSFFLYVPYLAPHKPAMAPEEYRNIPECAVITDERRRTYCGMVAAVDEGVGRIVDTLRQLGVLDDTIVFFTSDNGAALNAGADPWPLRGNKQTVYEGGTRVRTIMRARKCFPKLTGEYYGLMHVTDLLPTFIEATGVNLPIEGHIDGISAYQSLVSASPLTNREWMVYNIDHERQLAAIRFKNCTHDFKLVYYNKTRVTGWRAGDPRCAMNLTTCDKSIKSGYKTNGNPYRLFDMRTNPEEREPSDRFPDAAVQFPEFFNFTVAKMAEFDAQLVPVIKYEKIPATDPSKPKYNNGFWAVGGC